VKKKKDTETLILVIIVVVTFCAIGGAATVIIGKHRLNEIAGSAPGAAVYSNPVYAGQPGAAPGAPSLGSATAAKPAGTGAGIIRQESIC